MYLLRNITAGLHRQTYIPKKDQPVFLHRLSELRENGYPLDQSLSFLFLQFPSISQKGQLIKSLLNGSSISETFKSLGYPSYVCMHLYFAEQYGDVKSSLAETAVLMKHRESQRKKLLSILQYPLFLILLFVFVSSVLNLYLLPRMTQLYQAVGNEKSGVLHTAEMIFRIIPSIMMATSILIVILASIFSIVLLKKPSLEKWKIISSMPFAGFYFKHYHSYLFSREASILLKSGLSFQQMLKTFIDQPYRPLFKGIGQFMTEELHRGQSMHHTMLQLPYFTDELHRVTEHGEMNGNLEREWGFYSMYCLNALEERSGTYFQILQPVIFILLGLAVVGAYLIILLPVFNLLQNI
ncbi:competence type IV pilus assembly protein ComGB [Jeotgalibacillus haloalkalitolerans]|uniref:Competence type IV pilus assembly protein ComGB n=1 Tax=Jeotgalibacillus haloalkalitolerans TaxID=3104292 RepID=A0ABU5KN66_9BACL|nr:competence type IV pilus assembly protein ComGB [Jeotgalibacillus sp. HH7-29]MDZ5712155.1 competence type IV pilus assembly protein ComGB [Jeotgalibacillus sp. HH7-29]